MKKNLFSILLIIVIVISLTGCGSSKKEQNQKEKEEKIDVMPLYEEYLKGEKYKELFIDGEAKNYTFKDLNKDDVVELIIEGTYLKDYIRTILVAYNTNTKQVYEVINTYNTSGLLYNEEENNILFITRDRANTIRYGYSKLIKNQEKLETVKSYSYSLEKNTLDTYDYEKNEKGTIDAMDARKEADTYKYVGMKYLIDGTLIEETTRNIFEEYDINGFKINNVVLNYGLYKTNNGNLSINLFPDGTCRYIGVSNRYKGGNFNVTCFYHARANIIELWTDSLSKEELTVSKNDNMYSSWLDLNLVK